MELLGPFHHPDPPILCQNADTKAILDGVDLGNGTIYISERKLSWKNEQANGFAVNFPHISLHAITSDPNVYHSKCLFIIIDNRLAIEGYELPNDDDNESDSEDELEDETAKLLLIPNDLNSINTLFTALSHGQSLNPDPQDSIDEEDDDDMYDDAEDCFNDPAPAPVNNLGDGDINRLSSRLQTNSIHNSHCNGDQDIDEHQFEDAD